MTDRPIHSARTSRLLYLYFSLFLVGFVGAFSVAALEVWVDRGVILTLGEAHGPAVQATPLHQHAHALGSFYQRMIVSHVVTAHLLILLCVGYLRASVKKQPLHHYRKAFVALWVLHLANGGLPAMHRVVTHGLDERNYTVGFSLGQYVLFFIVVCVLCSSLARVALLDRPRTDFSRLDVRLMKAGVFFTFAVYALCFAMGFFVQFLADDAFAVTRSQGYGVVLMAFSGQAFLSKHNLRFVRAVEQGTAPEGSHLLERSRSLMVAVFLTEMTFLLNVSYRLGLERFNGLLWLGVGLLCWRHAGKAFVPRFAATPLPALEARAA